MAQKPSDFKMDPIDGEEMEKRIDKAVSQFVKIEWLFVFKKFTWVWFYFLFLLFTFLLTIKLALSLWP